MDSIQFYSPIFKVDTLITLCAIYSIVADLLNILYIFRATFLIMIFLSFCVIFFSNSFVFSSSYIVFYVRSCSCSAIPSNLNLDKEVV